MVSEVVTIRHITLDFYRVEYVGPTSNTANYRYVMAPDELGALKKFYAQEREEQAFSDFIVKEKEQKDV
jgi:hypothetical protein